MGTGAQEHRGAGTHERRGTRAQGNTSAGEHERRGTREQGYSDAPHHGNTGLLIYGRTRARGTVTPLTTGTRDHRAMYTRESDDRRTAPLGNAARTTRVKRPRSNRQ